MPSHNIPKTHLTERIVLDTALEVLSNTNKRLVEQVEQLELERDQLAEALIQYQARSGFQKPTVIRRRVEDE